MFEIDVDFAQDTVVRPDVPVICYQPESERLTRAPDLIFEVTSPRTTRRDEVVKLDLYRTEGVPHYVLVYPEAKKAKVWRLVEGEYRKAGDFHDETHCFELSKCAFDFAFSRLWKSKGGQRSPPRFARDALARRSNRTVGAPSVAILIPGNRLILAWPPMRKSKPSPVAAA